MSSFFFSIAYVAGALYIFILSIGRALHLGALLFFLLYTHGNWVRAPEPEIGG